MDFFFSNFKSLNYDPLIAKRGPSKSAALEKIDAIQYLKPPSFSPSSLFPGISWIYNDSFHPFSSKYTITKYPKVR